VFEQAFWWPLDLSARAETAFAALRDELTDRPPTLDIAAVRAACGSLTAVMRHHVDDIVERDGMPHLCHIVNGWGDARFRDHRLSDEVVRFVHRDADGRPFLLQCDPEGDFHPWQTFAYLVMAGADPDRRLAGADFSLRELARNSRYLNTDAGHELGHLLFALAYLDPDPAGRPFHLLDQVCDLENLMEMAVEAHHWGSFDVCRKFHLTEGLCAVASRVEGMERFRDSAQGFLDGQLDMLLLLGVILRQAATCQERGEAPKDDGLLREMRDTLVMGNFIENHIYYAGHLIEMAVFADLLGFDLRREHRAAIALVANELNRHLQHYLPHLYFPECFLHLGHYRRATSLLADLEEARSRGQRIESVDWSRYSVDFDALAADPTLAEGDPAPAAGPLPDTQGVFDLAPSTADPHPFFDQVVRCFAAAAAPGFEPRGQFSHFRRMGPPSWPRSVHYELLEYEGDGAGVEIHLESEAVEPLAAVVRGLEGRVAAAFPEQLVEWDSSWWSGRGRLRVRFTDTAAAEIAAGMQTLIDLTFETLDSAASRLRITSLRQRVASGAVE